MAQTLITAANIAGNLPVQELTLEDLLARNNMLLLAILKTLGEMGKGYVDPAEVLDELANLPSA